MQFVYTIATTDMVPFFPFPNVFPALFFICMRYKQPPPPLPPLVPANLIEAMPVLGLPMSAAGRSGDGSPCVDAQHAQDQTSIPLF